MAQRRFALPITLSLLVALSGCGGSSSSPTEPTTPSAGGQCSTLGPGRVRAHDAPGHLPLVRQADGSRPGRLHLAEAYLDNVRYRPVDTSYSYITSKAASDAFFSSSQFIGVGVSYRQTSASQLRISQTFAGSPAAEAGMTRGDYIVSINDRPTAQLLSTGEIATIFGPDEEGVTVTMARQTPGGPQRLATLVKRKVTIPTVSATAVLDSGGARVGYVFFRNFVTPSVEALNIAFDQLLAEGANELVLDLRYNGGGFVSVHLPWVP